MLLMNCCPKERRTLIRRKKPEGRTHSLIITCIITCDDYLMITIAFFLPAKSLCYNHHMHNYNIMTWQVRKKLSQSLRLTRTKHIVVPYRETADVSQKKNVHLPREVRLVCCNYNVHSLTRSLCREVTSYHRITHTK